MQSHKIQSFFIVILGIACFLMPYITLNIFPEPVLSSHSYYFRFLLTGIILGGIITKLQNSNTDTHIRINKIDLTIFVLFVYIAGHIAITGVNKFYYTAYSNLILTLFAYFSARYLATVYILKPLANFYHLVWGVSASGIVLSFNVISTHIQFYTNIPHQFNIPVLFDNSAILALYLVCLLWIIFYGFKTYPSKQKLIKTLSYIVLLLISVAIFLLNSRTAFITLFALFGYYYWDRINNIIKKRYSAIILFLGFLIFLPVLYFIRPDSVNGRLFIWKNVLQIIWQNPISGIGYNNFYAAYNLQKIEQFSDNSGVESLKHTDSVWFAFNEFLHYAAELGVFILIPIAVLLYFAFSTSCNTIICRKLITFSKGFIIIMLVAALFSYPLHRKTLFLFLLLAMAVLASTISSKSISFKVNQLIYKFTAAVLIVISVGFVTLDIREISAWSHWKHAQVLISNQQYDKANSEFKTAYKTLHHNSAFIYNYASELSSMGQYTATLNLYKRIAHIVNDAEINIFMGYCNYRLNNTGKAIELFKNAIKTNPVLIYPRYSLFKIYVELGNEQKATKIAEESMNIPKKKSNRDTKELITEMEKFLIMNNTDY